MREGTKLNCSDPSELALFFFKGKKRKKKKKEGKKKREMYQQPFPTNQPQMYSRFPPNVAQGGFANPQAMYGGGRGGGFGAPMMGGGGVGPYRGSGMMGGMPQGRGMGPGGERGRKPFVGGTLESQRAWERENTCCFFLQGMCRFGDACRFSHDRSKDNGCQFGLSCKVGHRPKKDEEEQQAQQQIEQPPQ